MSLAQRIKQIYTKQIGIVGETVYIRRYTGLAPSRTFVDTETKARITDYEPDNLVGQITQGTRRVIALVDGLSAIMPVTTSDKLYARGREVAIEAVDDNTRRVGGTLIALELRVKGV